VRIPAEAASARLTFWLRVEAYGDSVQVLDCLKVRARGADGKLNLLATYSNLDNGPDYVRHTLDLGAYCGQKLQLSFTAEGNMNGVNTSFTLDDVSLIAR
jgi:hypothetical protein